MKPALMLGFIYYEDGTIAFSNGYEYTMSQLINSCKNHKDIKLKTNIKLTYKDILIIRMNPEKGEFISIEFDKDVFCQTFITCLTDFENSYKMADE